MSWHAQSHFLLGRLKFNFISVKNNYSYEKRSNLNVFLDAECATSPATQHSTYKIKGADDFFAEKMKSFCTTEATVNPLYNSTHYNSKILYDDISISMEWLYFSKYVFFITANLVSPQNFWEHMSSL